MLKRLLVIITLLPTTVFAEPVPTPRHSATFEANLGLGVVNASGGGMSSNIGPAYDLHAGVGGWLGPRLALTLRAAITTIAPAPSTGGIVMADDVRRTFVFVGPSLQYWIGDRLWLGGGIGLAELVTRLGNLSGLGFDLRAGYTLAQRGTSTLNLSVELTPGFYGGGGGVTNDHGMILESRSSSAAVAFLVGYQYL